MSGKMTLRERSRALAQRHAKKLEPIERRTIAGIGGAAYGMLEKSGILPVSVKGVPTKPVVALLATLVELKSSGTVRRGAAALADGLTFAYAMEAAKAGNFIAGDE